MHLLSRSQGLRLVNEGTDQRHCPLARGPGRDSNSVESPRVQRLGDPVDQDPLHVHLPRILSRHKKPPLSSLPPPPIFPNMPFSPFPPCLHAPAMLAMLSLSCWHLASGHDTCVRACVRAWLPSSNWLYPSGAYLAASSGRDIGHPNIPSLRVARGGQSQCMPLSKPPAL